MTLLHNRGLATALTLAAFGGAGDVSATESDPLGGECRAGDHTGCWDGVSSPVTNGAMMRGTLNSQSAVVRERQGVVGGEASASRDAGPAWYAAGDAASARTGAWASYNYLDAASDFAVQGVALGFESEVHNALFGADRLFFGDRVLLGFSGGYTALTADTAGNGGTTENDGYTLAPYAAVTLSDVFSIDVSGGYAGLGYEQRRVSPTDGSPTLSDFDADRWFVLGNLNAGWTRGNWLASLRLGATHVAESQGAYVETGSAASAAGGTLRTVQEREIHLTQLIVGGELAYAGPLVEPYVMVAYHNDISRADDVGAGGMPAGFTVMQPIDDDEVQLALGLRCFTEGGVIATLEYLRVEGRDAFDLDSVMATLRVAF